MTALQLDCSYDFFYLLFTEGFFASTLTLWCVTLTSTLCAHPVTVHHHDSSFNSFLGVTVWTGFIDEVRLWPHATRDWCLPRRPYFWECEYIRWFIFKVFFSAPLMHSHSFYERVFSRVGSRLPTTSAGWSRPRAALPRTGSLHLERNRWPPLQREQGLRYTGIAVQSRRESMSNGHVSTNVST